MRQQKPWGQHHLRPERGLPPRPGYLRIQRPATPCSRPPPKNMTLDNCGGCEIARRLGTTGLSKISKFSKCGPPHILVRTLWFDFRGPRPEQDPGSTSTAAGLDLTRRKQTPPAALPVNQRRAHLIVVRQPSPVDLWSRGSNRQAQTATTVAPVCPRCPPALVKYGERESV